jgi:hypothetical protein
VESFPSVPSSLPCSFPSPPADNVAPAPAAVVGAVEVVVDARVEAAGGGGWSWKI